jgi:lipid-A-disaccharide synthase
MTNVLIVAGEASGDMHAANLIHGLRKIRPDVKVDAMGGQALRSTGANIVVDNNDLAVVGLVEVMSHYPVIRKALKSLQQRLITHRPELVILVDYVEFNLRLAKAAKKRGIKVLFYISPQVWAWRPGRVKKIGQLIDMMAVIFPFEAAFYHQHNIPVRYVGNPLVGKVHASRSREENMQRFELSGHTVIGIQPGSRRTEIQRVLPLFAQAVKCLKEKRPDLKFVLPVAPGIDAQFIRSHLPREHYIQLIEDESPYDVMHVCTAIMTASGTATLETALMGIPMVMGYKIAPLSYMILKRLVKIPYIGLVNIVAEKEIVKEYIQDEARPEILAQEISKLLDNKAYREAMMRDLNSVKEKLDDRKGVDIATVAAELLCSKQS